MAAIIKQISIEHGLRSARIRAVLLRRRRAAAWRSRWRASLKIPTVIVPPEPGNFSAIGMLLADPRLDIARTFIVQLNPRTLPRSPRRSPNWKRNRKPRCVANSAQATVTFEREAEMRYKGQQHSIKIAYCLDDDAAGAAGPLRSGIPAPLRPRQRHGRGRIVVLHSLATLHMKRPEIARLGRADGRRQSRGTRERGRSSFWKKTVFCRRESMIAMRCGLDFAAPGPASSSNTDRAR